MIGKFPHSTLLAAYDFHVCRIAKTALCGPCCGGVAEWSNALVLKTSVRESVPWVRIPPPPPLTIILSFYIIYLWGCGVLASPSMTPILNLHGGIMASTPPPGVRDNPGCFSNQSGRKRSGFESHLDSLHDAVCLGQDFEDALVVPHIVKAEGAAFAVFEPFLRGLVATNVELP